VVDVTIDVTATSCEILASFFYHTIGKSVTLICKLCENTKQLSTMAEVSDVGAGEQRMSTVGEKKVDRTLPL